MQKEKDPELRDQALLALAGRLERSERFSAATQIYSVLQQGSSGVSDRARGRLQALLGSGTFGAQAEVALGQLFNGIADPAALAAMGVAGATYRLVRLATLSRLAAAPNAGLLTRGFGARTLASSLAFVAEGSVFPAAHRLAARASGSKPAAAGFGEEVLSSYCVLGGLRLAAFAGGGLTRGRSLGWETGLLRQGSMLGGILLGSGLEKALGLRAEAAWSSTLAQSLATLLHFNAAGALFRSLSGPRFQSWEKGIDLRIQKLETGFPLVRGLSPSLAGPRLALASAGEQVWRMADGGNDGKPLFRGQKVPPLTLTFDETLAPKKARVEGPTAEPKAGRPSLPVANPELEVIFTLAMAGSSRNKPRFDAERISLPKKLEQMNEAQLQTVVKHIVTQIIENPLQAEEGEALSPSELIKRQRLRLKTSLDVLKSIHPREGAALRSATFSALLSMLQVAPAGWVGGTVRKEIDRGLKEVYTSADAVALADQVSKIMPQLANNDPIAGDYLQFLRKNLSLRQRKVFMENLIAEARGLTEGSRVRAVIAVLVEQMPDAVSLLSDGDAAPQGYFQFLREKLPPKQLRVLTQALIEETAKLPEKKQDKIIAEIERNWTAMNRLERDVILAGLKPKAGSSPAGKLAELFFDLQWQVESVAVGKRVALDEDIVHYLLEAPAKPDSEPVSGIQEKPTTRPPARHRPSASPGAVAIWGRKFEFNPKLVGPHDMTEISGMLTSWSSHKKPPPIVGKALIGVRDRHPDAEIRRRAAEIIQIHGLDGTDK